MTFGPVYDMFWGPQTHSIIHRQEKKQLELEPMAGLFDRRE